ncbi:MAG: hypothetical protein IT211_10955 [Armatimonadetes bacterium]|nr:hypothetical protein [Armatimonadota bacterium]
MQTTQAIVALLVGLFLTSLSLCAQDMDPLPGPDVVASKIGVVVAAKGGVVLSSPRGAFPSIIVGEGGEGTGDFASSNARSATGYRWGVAFLIPFNTKLGLSVDVGSMQHLVEYQATAATPGLQYHAQTAQLGFGLQGNLYFNEKTFYSSFSKGGEGLRAIYLDGGLDIGLGTMANRVEVTRTDSTGQPVVSVGSFENNEPLRIPVALRLAAGLRFAFSPHMELQAEAGYALALNNVFSSTVLANNNFSVDHLLVQLGVGYRW